jgi:hypothetical protein
MPQQFNNPDDLLIVQFKILALENEDKSKLAGRPIFDDVEQVEIRGPGSRNSNVHPATEVSHWIDDPYTGRQRQITYAERFNRQYQQFKEHAAQTASGTPLAHLPFLTEGKRAELRSQNVYTVEALAAVDGQELKNLGHGGRELKNKAEEYIARAMTAAPDMQLRAQLDALRARAEVLEADNAMLKANRIKDTAGEKLPPPTAEDKTEAMFDDMTYEQLVDYVTTHTGTAPVGNNSRKTLTRMAMTVKPSKAA